MNESNEVYVKYTRKSSEDDLRQVQSHDTQNFLLNERAKDRELKVVKEFQESHSAKLPGQRPGFEAMMKYIEDGKANAILAYNVSRLTRNPIDAGRIQWALQQGVIQRIVTMDRDYLPEDNSLILGVETGITTQFIRS